VLYLSGNQIKTSIPVKVKPEIEEMVRKIAYELGYMEYTIRNLAILLGLSIIKLARVPKTDKEFEKILDLVKVIVYDEKKET